LDACRDAGRAVTAALESCVESQCEQECILAMGRFNDLVTLAERIAGPQLLGLPEGYELPAKPCPVPGSFWRMQLWHVLMSLKQLGWCLIHGGADLMPCYANAPQKAQTNNGPV